MKIQFLYSILLLTTMLFSHSGTSQENGFIRGTIIDEKSNQTMPGVRISIPELAKGVRADLDGKYSFTVAPGTYSLELTFIGFEKIIIPAVVVKAGEASLVDDIYMQEATNELTTVVVTKQLKMQF